MASSRKLSRKKANREALLKNGFKSLVLHKRIITTEARAKEIQRFAEKIITKARRNDLAAKRFVDQKVSSKNVVKELFETVIPNLPKKESGFIKFQKVVHRGGDGADQAALIIEKKKEEIKAPAKKVKTVTKQKEDKPAKK